MLSVIIPTLDEEKTISRCLASVLNQPGDYEIIVVDGGSHDGTRKVVEKIGLPVIKGKRSIPKQLELGVSQAKGDAFLFLHADTILQKHAIVNIMEVIEEKKVEAGAFTLQYEKFDFLSSLQAWVTNWNAKHLGRCSGEQGIFMTREALYAAGGIPQTASFETEKLCARLKKAKKKCVILNQNILVSNRRFLRGGFKEFAKVNIGHTLSSMGFSDWHTKRFIGKVR